MNIVIAIVQALLVVALAPLFSGLSRWLTAKFNTRKGPSILQDYRDLYKLMFRTDLHTKDSSIIHRIMPPVFFGSMVVMALGIPMITRWSPIPILGDVIFLIYLLTLPRFFFALSGFDTSDAYASVGSVRELLVSVLVEPAMILAMVVLAIATHSTGLGPMAQSIASISASAPAGIAVAGVAFALACYVEMSKVPFDVSEAEQEIDGGPLTEYSGPSLGMLKLSLSMKQVLLVSWWLALFVPWAAAWDMSFPALVAGLGMWLGLLLVVVVLLSFFENALARVRYKLMGGQTAVMVGVSVLAFVLCVIGL